MIKVNSKPSRILIQTVLICIMLFRTPASGAERPAEMANSVEAHYFYYNPCASCDEESEFMKRYRDILGDSKSGLTVTLFMHNSFRTNESKLLDAFYNKYQVPEAARKLPVLFIGEEYFIGESEIEKNFSDSVREQMESSASENHGPGVLPEDRKERDERREDKGIWLNDQEMQTVVYFFVTACEDCTKAKKVLDKPENGQVAIEAFNITELSNLEILKRYYNIYGVPANEQIVPIVFIGDRYFSGADAIAGGLTRSLQMGLGFRTLNLLTSDITTESGGITIDSYNVIGVVTTGLINGLNPCSLSMLLMFLSTLMMKGVNILRFALSFIAGKFIAYMALGTVAYEMLSLVNEEFSGYVRLIAKAALLGGALVLMISNLVDYCRAKKERYHKIILQLPAALKRRNHQWIKAVSLDRGVRVLMLISFGLGALISLGEFLCTGQIFLAGILYVSRITPFLNNQALMYFTLYVLAMLVPLLLVTVLVWRGRGVFEVSEAIRRKVPAIKIINAVVFLILSLIVILFF